MSKEEIIEVDMCCFWINLDNPKEVSYKLFRPKENGNWKSILVEGYKGPLAPANNEIVYRLKNDSTRGYILKPNKDDKVY